MRDEPPKSVGKEPTRPCRVTTMTVLTMPVTLSCHVHDLGSQRRGVTKRWSAWKHVREPNLMMGIYADSHGDGTCKSDNRHTYYS